LSARYLDLSVERTLALRKSIIRDTAAAFEPDVLLVDKTPGGLCGELEPTLDYLRKHLPSTRTVLLLRDILDTAIVTREMWARNRYHEILEQNYDRVLIAGLAEVFNAPVEYNFSPVARRITRFTGYIGRQKGTRSVAEVRQQLGADVGDQIITVTTGGGEDGYAILDNALKAAQEPTWPKSALMVMVTGPDLDPARKASLFAAAKRMPRVRIMEFCDDMMSLFAASQVVITMGGYNSTCEVLSLRKRAIVIPRTVPVEEQSIRAERMARMGLLRMIPQRDLTPARLAADTALELAKSHNEPEAVLAMNGLSSIAAELLQQAELARAFDPDQVVDEDVLEVA